MADSMGEWHDDNFGLVMVGRFPERLPLDLGIEVLAREMGGHDIVIDTVLIQAYLWYTCRRHIWRPHYQHKTVPIPNARRPHPHVATH